MQTRPLGTTGHATSLAVLGTAAFWQVEQDTADEAVRAALAAGVTHVDVAPSYGVAEVRLAPWMQELAARDVLVSCKTMERTGDGARQELETSLARLGVERFAIYQLHAVTDIAELDRAMPALEALIAARDEGLVAAIGITGHGAAVPAAMLEALRRFEFATVMFPVNPRQWGIDSYRRDAEALLEQCRQREIGVLAIKAAAKQPRSETTDATTWYEPHTDPEAIARGVRFALTQPGVTGICTPGDVRLLPAALHAARHFEPMTTGEQSAAVDDASAYASIF